MAGKFQMRLKMSIRQLKKYKAELKRLENLPVPQIPGILGQAMPIPVVSGREVEYSRDDIRNLAANGARIYVGEPEGGQKSGPGK